MRTLPAAERRANQPRIGWLSQQCARRLTEFRQPGETVNGRLTGSAIRRPRRCLLRVEGLRQAGRDHSAARTLARSGSAWTSETAERVRERTEREIVTSAIKAKTEGAGGLPSPIQRRPPLTSSDISALHRLRQNDGAMEGVPRRAPAPAGWSEGGARKIPAKRQCANTKRQTEELGVGAFRGHPSGGGRRSIAGRNWSATDGDRKRTTEKFLEINFSRRPTNIQSTVDMAASDPAWAVRGRNRRPGPWDEFLKQFIDEDNAKMVIDFARWGDG